MNREKPKSESTGERPSDRPSAEQRAERLTRPDREPKAGRPATSPPDREADAGRPATTTPDRKADSSGKGGSGGSSGPGGSSGSGAHSRPGGTGKAPAGGPPRLTERQRKEARERRRRGGRTGGGRTGKRTASGSSPGNPLSRGARATLIELRRTAGFFRALILTGLDRLGPAVRWLTAALLELLSAAGTALGRVGRVLARALSRLGKDLVVLDRILTPRRAMICVLTAAIIALVASQFLDFRAAEVGQAAYSPIQDITRAPRIDVQTPIDAHSILLLVVGAMALAGLVGAPVTGRRAFGGLIALAGVATIAVTLLIDLPKGLDIAVAEISYSGVAAVLLSGFWLQLAAGFVMATGGLGLLALPGKESRSRARSTRARREPRPRPADAAGGLS